MQSRSARERSGVTYVEAGRATGNLIFASRSLPPRYTSLPRFIFIGVSDDQYCIPARTVAMGMPSPFSPPTQLCLDFVPGASNVVRHLSESHNLVRTCIVIDVLTVDSLSVQSLCLF